MERFLSLLLLLLLCTCSSPPATTDEALSQGQIGQFPDRAGLVSARPNILFIFTDDHAFDALGALGNEEINTPNLDKLVNRGTTFTHAYNMGAWQPAVCLASRAMLNTGKSLWKAQQLDRNRKNGDQATMADNWGPLMQRAGYATYFSGKWHVAAPAAEQFETVANVRPGMPHDGYPFSKMQALQARHGGSAPLDSIIALFPPGYNRPLHADDDSWSPSDPKYGGFWAGGKHWSEVLGDDGVRFLEQAATDERPFFMYLAFNAPHDPRQAPAAYVEQYNQEALSIPRSFQPAYPYAQQIGLGPGIRDEDLAPYPRTPLAIRTHKQEYYASITHLDAQVGRILVALEASGKQDSTVIIFTADHGLAVGRHGLLGKQNLYDHSIRVPLVLAGPGIPVGKQISQDVYLQDVMPTTLAMAGMKPPADIAFHSLIPLINGAKESYNSIYLAYTTLQRGIRADGFKYLVYPEVPVERLYHVAEDPEELVDLAGEPEYAKLLPEFRAKLRMWQTITGDTLKIPF